MKKALVACLGLVLSGVVLASPGQSWKDDESFVAFWQKFKVAVIQGDKETVIKLSSFPIRMPGRVRAIKDAADLRLRYKEVFNKRANAPKCFAKDDNEPVGQGEGGKPKEYGVFCDVETSERGDVVVYFLKFTGGGWKFVRFTQEALPD